MERKVAVKALGLEGWMRSRRMLEINRSTSLHNFLQNNADSLQPSLPPYIKSILKPTIMLSPPKSIPPRGNKGKASPGKATGPKPPMKSPGKSPIKPSSSVAQRSPNPFGASPKPTAARSQSPTRSPTRVSVRTEEEQQAAAKERERQEALAYKDARRKSLGGLSRHAVLARLTTYS